MLTRETVQELSSWELARLMMSKLWQLYDVGGISMRRSHIARLLESVYWLVQYKGEGADLEGVFPEVLRRIEVQSDIQLSLFTSLPDIPTFYLTCLVIDQMEKWYEKEERGGRWNGLREKQLICAIARLIRSREHSAQFFAIGKNLKGGTTSPLSSIYRINASYL